MWSLIVLTVLATLAYAAILTWGFGRRRPRSTNPMFSAIYFFMILFFATWAITTWIGIRGPLAWDAPWLLIVIAGAGVTMLLVATSERAPAVHASPMETRTARFGAGFWMLIATLLILVIVGTADRNPPEHILGTASSAQ